VRAAGAHRQPPACIARGADQAIASRIALMGRARTVLLAGLAANVCGCFVKGLIP
jgi:hypothetical protein